MTTNKDLIIDELKDEIENLAYENKRIGDFLEKIGLMPNDITSYVINGNEHDIDMAIKLIKLTLDY